MTWLVKLSHQLGLYSLIGKARGLIISYVVSIATAVSAWVISLTGKTAVFKIAKYGFDSHVTPRREYDYKRHARLGHRKNRWN